MLPEPGMHAAYLLAFIFPSSKHTPSCTLTNSDSYQPNEKNKPQE